MMRRLWTLATIMAAVLVTAAPGSGQVKVEEIVCTDGACEVHTGDDQVRVIRRGMAGQRVMLGVGISPEQGMEADRMGVEVTSVTGDSPAATAGLRAGDFITALNGHSLTEPMAGEDDMDFDADLSLAVQRLQAIMKEAEAGEAMALSYQRGDETFTTSIVPEMMDSPMVITLDGAEANWTTPEGGRIRILRDAPRGEFRFRTPGGEGGRAWSVAPGAGVLRLHDDNCGAMGGFMLGSGMGCVDGARMISLNPELGEYFGVESGVLVTDVDEESSLGLRPGDVLLSIGDREVRDPDHAERILRSYESDESITMTVRRNGREVAVEGSRG
jgi:membrane-associated protease RseP (regulator of RpoE activity)